MSAPVGRCRVCAAAVPETGLDPRGVCAACRARWTRRSRAPAALVAAGVLLVGLAVLVARAPEHFFAPLLLGLVLAAVLVYRVVRRVAFEILEARALPPDPPAA